MSFLKIVLGIIILTRGRRLYWLFLGGVGFFLGFGLAERLTHGQHGVIVIIAVVAGVAGALLAVFLQKFAIIAGGFLGGGYLLVELFRELGIAVVHYDWLVFLLGGICGAFLMWLLFGWTLVVLSSVLGSVLILQAVHVTSGVRKLLFVLLTVSGFAIQYGLFIRKSVPRRQ
jgi:hypothetical protein